MLLQGEDLKQRKIPSDQQKKKIHMFLHLFHNLSSFKNLKNLMKLKVEENTLQEIR